MVMTEELTFGGLPFRAANRPKRRFRPITALKAFRKLVADKEDTAQVFLIGESLSGPHFARRLRQIVETPEGRAAAESHENLIPYLDDHAALEKLPEGALGRAYLDFMRKEGLTAAGLEAEERRHRPETYDDLLQWHDDRLRDLHDLIHVLTGYSRGALGELANLGFTYGVNRGGLGDGFVALMGIVEMKRWFPKQPLFSVLREAVRNGRAARNFYIMDIRELFAMPLEDARAAIGVKPAPRYQAARAAINAMTTREAASAPYGAVASS